MRVDGPFLGAGFFKHRFEIILLRILLIVNPTYDMSGFIMLVEEYKLLVEGV